MCLTESTGTRFLHDVVRVVWVVRTVLCMVMVAESTHFNRLTNLFRYRREPLTFVRSGNSVVFSCTC